MTAGFTKPSTTNSSATLEIQGVRDIGLNSFWMSTTGFFFWKGSHVSHFPDGRKTLFSVGGIKAFP